MIDRPAQRTLLPRIAICIGIAVALFTAFSFAFVPLRSSQDEWWHLKAGKWILENSRLPETDIFTYTGENLPWHNHEWLSQVIFYGAYLEGEKSGLGGIRALILFKSAVVVLTFALLLGLIRQRGTPWAAAVLLAVLAAEISRRTIYPRPPIFSYLLLLVFLLLLYGWKLGRLRTRWLLVLLPLTVLWANLHGMVLLAVVATGCFAAGEGLEVLLTWWKQSRSDSAQQLISKQRWKPVFVLGLLTAGTVLAAMAQPSGYHLFFLGGKFMNDPLLKQVIVEMLPPPLPWRQLQDGTYLFIPGFATFWLSAVALVVLLAWNRGRLQFGADYFLVFFFLYQAVFHWRLLPLFALAAAAPAGWLITRRVSGLSERSSRIVERTLLGSALALAFAFIFLVDEGGTYLQRNRALLEGRAYNLVDYPKPLLDTIESLDLPDRMFSESNYCGYFMWRLAPETHRLFTDNRFDLFGSEFHYLERIVLAAGNKGDAFSADGEPFEMGWREILDTYGVNFLVIHRDTHLQAALVASGAWDDIYMYLPAEKATTRPRPEEGWSVWLRRKPEHAAALNRARELLKQEGTSLEQLRQWDQVLLESYLRKNPGRAAQLTAPDAATPADSEKDSIGTPDWRVR